MNSKDYYSNSNDYINRWVISYADFITMLLALFMVMYAVSAMGEGKVKDMNKSLEKVFSSHAQTNVKNSQKTAIETSDEEITEAIAADGDSEILAPEDIIEELKQNVELSNSVKLFKEKRGVVIRLNDNMLFDPGSAIIKPEAKAVLDEIAASLTTFDNPIVIEGHTDSIPIQNEKFPSNWELSTARATNIISYLTQRHKYAPGRLSAVGYGEYMPVAKNDDPVGRSKNRRVDIIILGSAMKSN